VDILPALSLRLPLLSAGRIRKDGASTPQKALAWNPLFTMDMSGLQEEQRVDGLRPQSILLYFPSFTAWGWDLPTRYDEEPKDASWRHF